MSYYEDLSADSSSDESTSSIEEKAAEVSDRLILHVDVDCFYCQCESIDKKIGDRPFAIGQKHIIVTCNYNARSYGVKKLQSREDAVKACPSLLIIEGSDLERYRRHARKIYETFRRLCKELSEDIAVRKGSMDEMMADLSGLKDQVEPESKNDVYLYEPQDAATFTEDQTGASTTHRGIICASNLSTSQKQRKARLLRVAQVAFRIRQILLKETGFTTTFGLSTNPLLAKVASGLKKPNTVNVLLPWDGEALIPTMPLRKIPTLGSKTFRVIVPLLEKEHGSRDKNLWQCRHLHRISKNDLQAALRSISGLEHTYSDKARELLDNCRGIDNSSVIDDEGGLPKVVSVENSFRRGTLCSEDGVRSSLDDLCRRLPRLLKDRENWSNTPDQAYPTTIRLVVREVVENPPPGRRRPFATRSKQATFDGRRLLGKSVEEIQYILRESITPLLYSLLPSKVNVTRINVAVSNFQDVPSTSPTSKRDSLSQIQASQKTRRIDDFFARK